MQFRRAYEVRARRLRRGCSLWLAGSLAGLAAAAPASPAWAQSQFPTPAANSLVKGEAVLIPNGASAGGQTVFAPPSSTNPLPVRNSATTASGSVTPATVGTVSVQVLAGAVRKFLAIDNESPSTMLACALGSTAMLNSAGSFTIPAGTTRTWDGSFVPSDAVNCVASAAGTPVTLEAE